MWKYNNHHSHEAYYLLQESLYLFVIFMIQSRWCLKPDRQKKSKEAIWLQLVRPKKETQNSYWSILIPNRKKAHLILLWAHPSLHEKLKIVGSDVVMEIATTCHTLPLNHLNLHSVWEWTSIPKGSTRHLMTGNRVQIRCVTLLISCMRKVPNKNLPVPSDHVFPKMLDMDVYRLSSWLDGKWKGKCANWIF